MWLSHVYIAFAVKICLFLFSLSVSNNEGDANELFDLYIKKFHKLYIPGTLEYDVRLSIFKESLRRIYSLNKNRSHPDDAWWGLNEYSDLTPEEFKQLMNKREIVRKNRNHKHVLRRSTEAINFKNITKLPKRVDWRQRGIVTPVKNQKECGACWAFSTVETLESMNALKTGKLVELSVQQVIDCATETNHGCDGGNTCNALHWMIENRVKILTDKEYPLTDKAEYCKAIKPKEGVELKFNYTCEDLKESEGEMLKLLAFHGPLVASVDSSTWQDYLGGIIQYHCEDNSNHAVQIVGYDLTGDIPYYIVRNSWGIEFGIDGYLKIAIGKNLCGIALEVSALDVV
uniref:Cathepsin O-like cysteine peptidase protein n=1 Tax=Tityus serrulatus TaxID=6887 RepID=U6JMC8_TITSE|nr:cathepsin O-like cysteine peptidase protein [Tityus serrulatus]